MRAASQEYKHQAIGHSALRRSSDFALEKAKPPAHIRRIREKGNRHGNRCSGEFWARQRYECISSGKPKPLRAPPPLVRMNFSTYGNKLRHQGLASLKKAYNSLSAQTQLRLGSTTGDTRRMTLQSRPIGCPDNSPDILA